MGLAEHDYKTTLLNEEENSMTNIAKREDTSALDKHIDIYDSWFTPTIFGRSAWEDVVGEFFGNFDRSFGNDQIVPCDVVQYKDDDGNITATEIQYALAGYNKDNVTIEVNGDKLTIIIEKTDSKEDTSKNKHYVHKGISHRKIETRYNLSGYDKDHIEASFENGILSLKLPVTQKDEVKKIEIK